jgi:hypothetical protein
MAQDNIKNLYDALKGDYDLGSEQDFRNSLKDANNRRNLYKAISGSYDLGSEQDFDRSLGYGQSESKQTAGKAAQQVIDEYDRSDKMTDTEREDMADWAAGLRHDVKTSTRQASNKIRYSQELARNPLRINRNNVGTDTNPMQFGENPNVVETGKRYDNESGKFKPVYITETGNEYINRLEADREQNRIDKEKREEEQRKREEEAKMQHDPTLWETVKKSLGAGFMRVGAGLLDTMQSLTSGMIVEDPSSPAGYTRTRSYEEALSDKNDPLTTASSYLHGTADRMSEEAQPHSGRKGFLDMLWDGEIGGFLQKGIATTGESLPMTLSAFNPYTMTLNAISMAGSNYRENTLANPDIPEWKRAAQAVGSAAIEQAVEKYSDPIFKYVGGGKILRGASKNASEKITNDITGKATETLAKRIYGRLKGIGKDALGEGAEEIIGNAGNDILGETLDIVDGNEDYGLRAQWEEMKKENPDADLTDFSKAKAKEYVESFIGGAMAGAYTSGTAQLSTKALQYSFDKLGGGSVEENEEQSLNPLNVDVAQSYDEGYSEDETTGLQDTKNLYELRQNQMAAMFGVDAGQVDETIGDPVNFIGELQRLERNDEIQPVLDYINAKAKFDGMIQRVRDDIDGRIEQSNKMVNERTNHETGMIQGATLKVQDTDGNDRRAYILSGNLVMLPDGTGVDREKSGNSILILHEDTNEMEMVSPDAIFNIEQPVDPETEKQTAAEAIRQQYGQQEANRIDGVVPFYPGDTYTVTDESGQAAQIQVVPNKDGLVDNGDGTVNVSSDGGQTVVPMRKEDIQAMVDATNRARVAQVEQQREAMQQPQVQEQPTYSLNDEVTLLDENGNEIRGSITADVNEDGQYEVNTENPINGRKVNLFTAEELNNLNANAAENSLQNGGNLTENGGNSAENSHQENIATVNQDAINNATVDDLLKADSSRVESYYREHPEEVAEALATPAQATADYINGKLTDRDYLIALGYSTGENSWLDSSATDEEIAETVAENRGKYLPYVTMPQVQQPSNEQSNAQEQPVQTEQPGQSAMERIPKDEQGQPVYEQADPDTAWDAIVEQAEGDESMAQSVADSMVADKEAELKKVEKTKPKGGTTIAEKIAAERERKNAVEQAKANLALWQRIAQTSQRRRQAAMAEQSRQAAEAARLRREQEEQERAAREEAERIRREALNGVPDFVDDTPQDARARGYRRVNGEKVDRQPSVPARQGREVQVKFDDKNIPTGHVALIEASQLQPSHINGRRNPFHFIDEAQPKERNDDASVMSARRIAANIRPEEITSSVTAYTGAPTVNTRGEVIQGNNRSAALREMWAGQPEQAAKYKQYLAAHAADFGLAPEDVEAMQQPVLVNMLDVPDEDAITLGQFVASDTESGGTERIKPKNIVQKMGDDMRSFAGRLLASPDEEMTFSELVDRNGMDVLKWMQAKNYITPTQYRSAFDSKGNLTGEAKNDLKGIMYQSIFQNGNTHLEEMFGALPAKAQKAILATAYRDYDSPNRERLNTELQNSISAYYALSQMPDFANAKNYKEAAMAVEAWKRQYALDDVTGESYLPSERYSNFALLLATMYKGQTQTFIQNTFNHIYDLVQGTQEATLFEEPDNTPRTLVEAINETLSGLSEELLLNGNFIYNGQRRNNVLAGSGTTGQPRGQGSPGSSQAGGRIEDGTETSNGNRRTEISGKQGQIEGRNDSQLERDSSPKQEEYTLSSKRSGNGEPFYQDADGNIDLVDIPQKVFDEIGYSKAPFRLTPSMILHVLNGHGKELGVSTVEETLHFVLDVMNHFDHVRLGYDGALIFSIENGRKRIGKRAVTILINSDNGKFYGLKTSGYETVNGLSKRPLLWERGAENVSSTTDAASASVSTGKSPLSGEQSGSASHQSKSLSLSNEVYSRHATTKQSAETVEVSQKAEQRGTQTSSRMSTSTSSQNKTVLQTAASKPHGDSIVSNGKDTEKSRISSGLGEKIAQAEAETNQNPTEAQKEAGNYKKGHVRIGQFDITVENPKGSVRRGTDQNGNSWETTMHNTYGYIRGTEGVDGDHIDVFLTDDIDGWNGRRVYVVDQYNEDGTFDEHKVMLGFNDEDDARNAYLSNYSEDWANNRKIVMTSTNLEDFEKWIDSSHRKTKPFAEYKSVNVDATKAVSPADRIAEIDAQMADLKKQADEAHRHSDLFEEARLISESNELYAERRRLMQEMQSSQAEEESNEQPQEQQGQTDDRYTVEQRYHKKKDTYIYAVKFTEQMPREQFLSLKKRVKDFGGYYSSYGKGGFIFDTEEAGRKFAEAVLDPSGEKLDDNKPLSLADMQQNSEPVMRQVDVEGLMQAINENGEAKLSDHFVMGRPGLTEKATNKQSDNTAQEKKPKNSGQFGLVSDERMEELKKRLKQKILGQMNMGVDPEILAIGMELTAGYIDRGIKKFADYAKVMIDSLGDDIRPYLKAFYNGARDLPEVQESGLANEMTPYEEVRTFDVANFDKGHSDALATAEMVVQEQEADRQADEAKDKLIERRNEQRRKERPKKQNELKIADLFSGQQEETVTESPNDKSKNTAVLNAENTEINRKFADAVKADMLSALDSGTKPYRNILDLRKRAAGLRMEVDNDGRTDILLQELVEDGLVRAAREVVNKHGRDSRESYDLICKLYDMQPTIAARSSNRIKMQQYSTPLPMAWNAAHFAMSGKKDGKVLEPTAGNGMLVFAVPANQVHANELDETRLGNLREQGFAEVTQQDAVEPFEGGKQYDVVIANPPFGKREAVNYDGKLIPGLDPQITLNALASMKDDGKAAIIIGGNMEYGSNGGLKSMKPFFTYLYDHYNVKGVVDMDGSLYAKQGTTYPTRMILIDGRRSDEERAQSAVYPPVQSKAIRKADSFETLYDIIDEVINSNEKTNGTEILRSQQGQLVSVADQPSRNADGKRHTEQSRKDDTGRPGGRTSVEGTQEQGEVVLRREHRTDTGNGEARRGAGGNTEGGSRRVSEPDVQRVERVGVSTERVGLEPQRTAEQPKKRGLSEEKLPYRPHNTAFSLQSVAPAAMVEAMDRTLSQIEKKHGNIDEFVRKELGYDTTDELHQALAAEQIDSVAMAIYQMKQGQALIIGDQTGVGKGRQMAALIRWAVRQGEKPIFITQKADLFSDIYRDLVDIGSGDLVPFIFNSPSAKENKGEMVDANGKVVYKGLSDAKMKKVLATGKLPDECDYAVLTYSQVNTGDEVSQKEMEEAAKKNKTRSKKSKSAKDGKATPKATFLRSIAEDNYLFLDESHTAAGSSNTGAYLQSILRSAKAATFASATFAKRPDTMPLYAIRTAMSQAKVEPDKLISIIEKGGVTLQEIMSRELTNAGQMVRRERDMSDVVTDWKAINDPETVRRARENYDRTIAAFNAIIKFQEDYVKPMVDAMDKELAVMAESAGIKRGTDKLGVENVPFASKTYNYTKQLMLALKVDAIANEVDAEIKAGRHPVIALESTMESSIKDYSAGEVISEPTFSASLLRGLDTVMQYTVKDENGKEQHARYSPKQLGPAGEKAYYELQDFIRESTSDIFISPLDAIIERLHDMGYKVGELTGRNLYVERDNEGRVIVKRRTDKDKKRMQREFNNGELDVLILNKSASTGISLHASEKFSDQRQRTMIIAQPLSDINDYMQMIGRIDRTGQVHRGYYINLGLPVPAENRFLMMLSTKLKSLNANTTTSQDSESNEVEAPDLLNKYGSQVVVEYLRDNPDIYEKMGSPLKKGGENGGRVQTGELDEYKPQEDDARKITGYVALLTTQEQEEFYDDVVRRYNELIKYLNDTGNNDLKITVMPLRAKTLEKRVSSEGIDPTGANPFAQNSYVEQVEMDVLRKPMKADEIRKTIKQVNKGKRPEDYIRQVISTIEKEDEARIAAEEARYERSKVRAQEDIAKQTEKINRQQKRSAEEKQAAIADYVRETNENVETKHNDNIVRLNTNSDMLKQRLHMFEVGKSYLMPDNLESMVFDFSTPAIFCGYKAKDSKITASTTLAVFATLDGRRRVEVKLSDIAALRSIYKATNDNWDAARSTTLENWDGQIPTGTRKTGYIMTGNILQAIADTQDERGGFPGQLISYTDIDGNVHDGILMPDKWNRSMLKTSGAPIVSRLKQIKDYMPVTSHDGKVEITGSSWAKVYYLTVPKTKKDGAVYYENKALLRAVNGSNFYPYRGKLRADIPEENIERVVRELSKLGVKVKEESDEGNVLYRNGDEGLKKVNERFNEKLNGLTEANADKVVLSLGRPSDILRAAGVEDKPMKLYGNKVMKKMRKHGFTLDELHDLPQAVAEPIAVFKNYGKDGNRSILTELKTEQGNFLVTLTLGEGHDVDFNIVTSVFGKGESNIIDWIKRGFATYINKGKALNYLHHSALKAVTSDNQELISAANIVRNFENPSVEKENLRDGNGALSDDDLSVANDPVSKLLGKSTRTAAQRRAFAERERQRMMNAVQKLAETLHLDNVDIVTDASTLQGRRAKAKGFYSRGTGRITIVIPNHASVYDVEQTLLHEAVAHYGLRQLFGEHFDTFLDNVFQNAEKGIQERIAQIEERLYQADIEERTKRKGGGVFARAEAVTEANTKRRNGDYRKAATEEYLASLAENTNFDNTDASWWQKIKELFLRMLHKIGFENFSGVTLSDNELRYILWRSYENLAEPGRYRSILGEAEDVAKQNELKVGNYAPAETATSNAAEASKNTDSGEDLFRDNEDDASAIYEKGVANTFWHRFSEGWYDYLRSVRVLQDALQKAMGRKLDDFENVLLNALHKTSVDKAQWDKLKKNYIDPLSKSLAKVVDGKKMFRDGKLTQDDVEIYLNCKHGLERNDKFAMRDAEQMRDERIKKADDELAKEEREAKSAMDRAIKRADQRLQDGEIDGVKHDQLINDAKKEYDKSIKKAEDAHEKAVKEAENSVSKDYQKNRERDYSGLTEIFDPEGEAGYTNAELEDLAKQYVADMEQTVQQQELDELWDKIHKINAYSLKKSYESGLISKQTYESTKDMFDYYVPLRGFEKETANDVYDYITESDIPIEQVMKHAKGRTSRATNLIATMMNMAHSSIVSGNRNLVKQKLLNLALNADNDLLTIGNQWYEDDGMGGWIPVQEPPIRDGMTAKEAREVVEQFEENMKEREKNGEVRRMRKGVSLPIRIVGKRAENEHGVRVKRNGQEYVVWINGNPKAAQSINGILNPETERGWLLDHIHKLNRFVSKNVTSLRPNFLLSNLKRDILSSNMVGFVKYGLKYTRMFDKFVKDNLSIVDVKGAKAGKMRGIYALYHRYNNGTLDLNDKRDRYFKEFMENGGETGYSQMWSIDDYEKQIRRTLNKDTAKEKFRNGWQAVGDAVEFANRGIENVCRFAAYMASRESGMSVLQSIADAKEASVNFNRKGSGAMGNNAARAVFMFLNPAIQGFMQHNKLLMKYPKRMLAIDGGLIALGVIVGLVNSLIWGGGDDDDDKETENDYFNINPFVRRNNIVLRMGRHEYAKIDLPQELRPWYGLGEIAYAAMTGHMKHDNVGVELFSQLTQTIPLNPITGNALLSPDEPIGANVARNILGSMATGSITDAFVFDKDYAGNKITRANDYNKFDPEWKRAGRGTSSLMIGTTKMLNDLTGGNDYKKGWWDWNPSRWEHVATSLLGGRVEFFKQLWTTGQALVSGDEDERNNMRNYPFVSTSYINTDNSYNRNYRLNNEFDWYQHEFEQARHEYNGLKNDKKNVFEKAEEFDAFIQTPEYKIYRRFKKYDRRLKKQFEKLSDETDDDKRKKINDKITEIKKEAVEEMQRISK